MSVSLCMKLYSTIANCCICCSSEELASLYPELHTAQHSTTRQPGRQGHYCQGHAGETRLPTPWDMPEAARWAQPMLMYSFKTLESRLFY
jgi:hypothetical protein